VAATALLVGCAWLIARMEPLGWWLVLVGTVLAVAGTAYLIQRLDLVALITEVVAALPLPEAERAEVQAGLAKESAALDMAAEWIRGSWLIVALSALPFVCYLVWIQRWFNPAPVPTVRNP
jgi:hypothetical protein